MNPLYTVVKIDLMDSYPLADIFDEDKYTILDSGDNLDKMFGDAVVGFFETNPKMKSYKQWLEAAEDGAYEYAILAGGKEIFRVSSVLQSQEIYNSLFLIKKYHSGQKRKGDGHPYLEHPLEVAHILFRARLDPDIIAAGYCHDLLEDTDCQEHEIEEKCGKEVLRIVKAVSNDEELSDKADWEKKKSKYVESVRAGGEKAIAVSVADKIANLYSFLEQYKKEGPKLWQKFNRGKDKKVWFEKEVLKMAQEGWKHPMLKTLEALIQKLEETEA